MNEGHQEHPHIKPRMSAAEASWHETVAGQRAAETARQSGADPHAVAAVASATAGPVVIAGHRIHPASQGTVWTLQRAARIFAEWADAEGLPAAADPASPGTRELLELGLTTLIFADARGCWRALDACGFPALLAQAERIMWDMPVADSMALRKAFEREMETIRRVAGDEEGGPAGDDAKKRIPHGASPVPPIPPPAPDSLPSSGLPPSTASLSPMPSGTPL